MNSGRLSIIIPVFNAEKTLERCIQSVRLQTIRDIEIILVNDGSYDRSRSIIEKNAERDRRIVSVHQENAGIADARNAGIKIAKGEFIGFVDADDWVEPDVFEALIDLADTNKADACYAGAIHVIADGQYREVPHPLAGCTLTTNGDLRAFRKRYYGTIPEDNGYLPISVWRAVYKRRLLMDKRIHFPNVANFEDALFNIMFLRHAKCISVADYCGYYYDISSESSASKGVSKKAIGLLDESIAVLLEQASHEEAALRGECFRRVSSLALSSCRSKAIRVSRLNAPRGDKNELYSEICKMSCLKQIAANPQSCTEPVAIKLFNEAILNSRMVSIHAFAAAFGYAASIKNRQMPMRFGVGKRFAK